MRCEGVKACKHRARFKFSTDNGFVVVLCGLHLLKLVRRFRPLIGRGHTTVFIQKFNPHTVLGENQK